MLAGAMAGLMFYWKNACFLVLIFFYGCLCSLLSDKCLGSPTSDEMSMRLKLIHLYSSESPYYDPSLTSAQKLSNLMKMDSLRSSQFSSMIKTQQQQQQQQQQKKEFVGGDNPRSNIFSGVSLGLGQYLVEFMLGSPAQKFLLIIDTGSDLVWVQCYPCHGCSSLPGAVFLPQNSSTFFQLPCSSDACIQVPAPAHDTCSDRYPSSCRYLYRYSDDSRSSGILCSDTATLNSTSGRRVQFSDIAFGCGSRNAGSFKGSSGVLGLGQGDISFTSQVSQNYTKFSYCLGDYLRSRLSTSLILFAKGAEDESLKSSFHFTPLVRNSLISTFYYVKVKEVSVGEEGVLAIPDYVWEIDLLGNGGTVIDSGSTLSVFKTPAYSLILGAFERSIHYPLTHSFQGLDLCFNVSGISHPLLPAFSISFDGYAVFQPPPSNYFVEVAESVRCLAIQGTSSPFAFNVVGNLLQQNFHIQFDRDNAQLGFAQANCSQL